VSLIEIGGSFMLIVMKIQVKMEKDKVVPQHTLKAYRGSRGITPLILKLGTSWR
jgi:hypothetical protein